MPDSVNSFYVRTFNQSKDFLIVFQKLASNRKMDSFICSFFGFELICKKAFLKKEKKCKFV